MTDYSYFSSDYFEDGEKCGTAYSNYKESVRTSPIYRGIAETIFKILKPKRVLEIGCATGIVVRHLCELGTEAHGIDVSAWAIENKEHPNVLLCGAEKLPYQTGYFDLVYSIHSLEHIPAHLSETAFSEIARVCNQTQLHMLPMIGTSPYHGEYDAVMAGLRKDPTHNLLQARDWWVSQFNKQGFHLISNRIIWPVDTDNFELSSCQVLLERNKSQHENNISDIQYRIDAHNLEITQNLYSKVFRQKHRVIPQSSDQHEHYFDAVSPELNLKEHWNDLYIVYPVPVDFSNCAFTLLASIKSRSETIALRIAFITEDDNQLGVFERWFTFSEGLNINLFALDELTKLTGAPKINTIHKIYFGGQAPDISAKILLMAHDAKDRSKAIQGWEVNT